MARLRRVFNDISGSHWPIRSLTAENNAGEHQITFTADVAIIDVIARLFDEEERIEYKSHCRKIFVTGHLAIKVALQLLVENEYLGESLKCDTLRKFPSFTTPTLFKTHASLEGEKTLSAKSGFLFKH
jgi:hypothetical protein